MRFNVRSQYSVRAASIELPLKRTARRIMIRKVLQVGLAVSVSLWLAAICHATEEYANDTNLDCASCHLASSGGGELTPAGESFMAFIELAPEVDAAPPASPSVRLLRLAAGYVHVFTAVFWFGTILYVHIVLKPSYAAKGLPRGEVKVGLVSMAIMGVTGAVLTTLRVPSPALLLETRFGVLLVIKIAIYLAMVTSALVVVLVIGPRLRRKTVAAGDGAPAGTFTAEQLAAFDGTAGSKAYVAYNGGIYDVTASGAWQQGSHFAKHQAGTDLTSMIAQAPHNEEWILGMPRVGDLVLTSTPAKPSPAKRLFLFMTYFNLVNVTLVILILVLWRWW
jgi:predicted heme/steroid binding protein